MKPLITILQVAGFILALVIVLELLLFVGGKISGKKPHHFRDIPDGLECVKVAGFNKLAISCDWETYHANKTR